MASGVNASRKYVDTLEYMEGGVKLVHDYI